MWGIEQYFEKERRVERSKWRIKCKKRLIKHQKRWIELKV
jgi:hypothetical protein